VQWDKIYNQIYGWEFCINGKDIIFYAIHFTHVFLALDIAQMVKFTRSFYVRRFQKCKKDSQDISVFFRFWDLLH
jgi:hypothetical protein